MSQVSVSSSNLSSGAPSGVMRETYDLIRRILPGVAFIAVLTTAAMYLSRLEQMQALRISPLIIGIVLGMMVGNFFRRQIPYACSLGIVFSTKKLLRLGIILYGFRLTFQQLVAVGFDGVIVSAFMVTSTFLIGVFVGRRILGLDRDTAILTASGSAVCGAAAVLATESVLGAERHKSAVAVATVVLFGTISMFLFPLMYSSGILGLDPSVFGIYVGGSVHEVAQVVAVGNAVDGAADNAVIVKMTRVMLIVPLLLALSYWLQRGAKKSGASSQGKGLYIPWFAVLFVVMSGVNSLQFIQGGLHEAILFIDTIALTMAMTALGVETNASKFKEVGAKPFYLAFSMFLWLLLAGYLLGKFVVG